MLNLGIPKGVSIHAPTKGATAHQHPRDGICPVSIHAPTKGATHCCTCSFSSNCFNPRSHEGSDVSPPAHVDDYHCFNPRSHEGSDRLPCCSAISCGVSIHAPTKGATAISAKNSFQFSAKINKLSFYILNFPLFPSPLFSTFHFICAYFRVRIPRHFYVCFLFALLYYHKINVSSTAIPRSTPICSTFV